MNPNHHHARPASGNRILLATIGSLGDLHPCLALALELKRRGHSVVVASTECYRPKVEALGIPFKPIRPNWDLSHPDFIRESGNLKRGFEVLYRNWLIPHLKDTYRDLLPAASESDLMIAGELNLAAPLVAERLGLPWASAILSPVSFLSAYDPSVLVNASWLFPARKAGRPVYRALLNIGRLTVHHWWNPIRTLRRQQFLIPHADPVFRDKFSPQLVLALFSHWLAKPQLDWPSQTLQTGFVYFDGNEPHNAVDPRVTAFLASGDPPIVCTQGSTAVHNPGDFYQVAAEAATRLGRRTILIGAPPNSSSCSNHLLTVTYAPYSQVFPHAAVNVHQGGSGTTGQAMRAGRPQLIVPYGWDQPDNAARVERLGAGLHVPRTRWSPETATAALQRLLDDKTYSVRAAQVGADIQAEDSLASACNAIESLLKR